MEVYFISAIAAFSLLFHFCWHRWCHKSKDGAHAPPEAGGARLFTGHLHLMAGATSTEQLPHFNLARLADKHGPIFTIRLGARRAVVVSSWELAKEVFTTCDAAISSRPRLRSSHLLSFDFAVFGLAPYGPYWRQMRKIAATELLSARRLELQREATMSENAQFLNTLYKLWAEKRDGSGRALVDMKHRLGELSLNVLFRMVAGIRFQGGDDTEETRHCQEVMREFFYLRGMYLPADALPYLRWLDLGGFEKRMKKNAKELDVIVGGWVSDHLRKENSGEEKPRDFIDVMLSVSETADLQYDTHTITKAMCLNLISGGTDTTMVMLIWTISLLMNNRHVLRKAQEELDQHVGRERRVDEPDIQNLVYLQAIVKETLRLYPAGPIGGIREFDKDCNVRGYQVTKGSWLIVNLWKLHRDPRVWPEDPLAFRPERWHQDIQVKGQDFRFIPFGGGRRSCPGINLGMLMLHLVLANLLNAFELSTVGDEEVDMSESAGLTNLKDTPLDLLLAPRLPSALYHLI